MQRITGVDSKIRLIATLLPIGYLCANSVNYISELTSPTSLFYLLGILNSKALNFYFKQTSTNTNVTSSEISKFPIPPATPTQQQAIIDLVNQILTAKENSPQADTSVLEKEIDTLVYELYGLNEEEIKMIEG